MKKAKFLAIAIVAALLVPIAFHVVADGTRTQNDWSTTDRFNEATASSPLPDLSESVAPTRPNSSDDQTDNTTTITSGGAVKASFTVLAQPAGSQEESAPAETRPMPNNESQAAVPVRRESGGLTTGWALLAAVLSFETMAISIIVLRRLRAKADSDV